MLTTGNSNAVIPTRGVIMVTEPKKIKIILTKTIRRAERESSATDAKFVAKILPPGTVLELAPVDANELIFSNKAALYSAEAEKEVKASIKAKEEAKAAASKPAKKERE
jgi:hypothetical protein